MSVWIDEYNDWGELDRLIDKDIMLNIFNEPFNNTFPKFPTIAHQFQLFDKEECE